MCDRNVKNTCTFSLCVLILFRIVDELGVDRSIIAGELPSFPIDQMLVRLLNLDIYFLFWIKLSSKINLTGKFCDLFAQVYNCIFILLV